MSTILEEEPKTSQDPPVDDVDPEGGEGELVDEDDTVIARALRRSLAALAGLAVVAAVVYLVVNRPEEAAEEQTITSAAPEAVVQAADPPPLAFTDVTVEAGITFVHVNGATGEKLLPETMGGGVAFFDYDNDGDPDLLFVNSSTWPHDPPPRGGPPTMALYRNDGTGRFDDVTREAGLDLSFYGMGAAVADYDGDGWRDVFLTAVGENRLLKNHEGTFVDVTAAAGVAGTAEAWSTSAGFFDYDADSDLDLFVCNYVRWSREIDFEIDFRLTGVGRAFGPPQSYQGSYPFFYRNEGGGADGIVTFTDVSASSGVEVRNPATDVPVGKSLALLPIDVDADGYLDVMVANDTVQNFLFYNQGGGADGQVTFVEAAEDFGLAYDRNGNATGAMGIDAAYYRNDHNLGFLIGNFANEMSSVYMSQDAPDFFVDEAISEGIGAPSRRMLTFGLFLFDVDLDGRLDLLQANGHIEDKIAQVDPSQSYRQPGQLFWNAGADFGFVEVPVESTGDLAREIVGRGAAYADIDGDGDLDVGLTQIAGRPLLLRNDQNLGHHYVRVRLVGKAPNRDAVGAWVELVAGGRTQRRQVMPVRSYLSSVEPELTFGLGTAESVDSLTVTWPDGSTQTVDGVELDALRVVEQL